MVEILKFGRNCEIWSKLLPGGSLTFPKCPGLPNQYHQLELSWHLHQPDTSVKSTKHQLLSIRQTLGAIDRTPGIPGSDKKSQNYLGNNFFDFEGVGLTKFFFSTEGLF